MGDALGMDELQAIADKIARRRDLWPDEPIQTSVLVVLCNAGDDRVAVSCIVGEWSGTKADLSGGGGLPMCPNGHALFESGEGRVRLGWVPEVLP